MTSVGPKSAALIYQISLISPTLPKASKTAISKNYNGAPLSGKPTVHKVAAEAIDCHERSAGEKKPLCAVKFATGTPLSLEGEKAADLMRALEHAGVTPKQDAEQIRRGIERLACVVDDKAAQTETGNEMTVDGFSCEFLER
jgi:hypothetical protein